MSHCQEATAPSGRGRAALLLFSHNSGKQYSDHGRHAIKKTSGEKKRELNAERLHAYANKTAAPLKRPKPLLAREKVKTAEELACLQQQHAGGAGGGRDTAGPCPESHRRYRWGNPKTPASRKATE